MITQSMEMAHKIDSCRDRCTNSTMLGGGTNLKTIN